MKGDGNLKIDNVDIKDGGDWTCYNSDTNSTGTNVGFRLRGPIFGRKKNLDNCFHVE